MGSERTKGLVLVGGLAALLLWLNSRRGQLVPATTAVGSAGGCGCKH